MRATGGASIKLTSGPYLPLDEDWGARVGCYALVASGLRNVERLHKAATNIQHADGTEAAAGEPYARFASWWRPFGEILSPLDNERKK